MMQDYCRHSSAAFYVDSALTLVALAMGVARVMTATVHEDVRRP
jgi:hypothetical protein